MSKAIRASILKAMAHTGGSRGAVAHVVRRLWRSGDPELRMEAHLLLRYFKKGPEPAKPTIGRPPQPIKCKRMLSGENKECEVPRNVIAREVYRRLTPDPAPGSDLVVFDSDERRRSLRRRNLAKAVRETADFFSISQNVARDCFEPHCDDLLLFGEAIGYS